MSQEGNKIKFATNGIERATSNYNASKGGCNEIIGMIYRDGSLVPYEPVDTQIIVKRTIDNIDYPFGKIWVHKTTKQNNYISLMLSNGVYHMIWINEASLPLTPQSTDNWKTISMNIPTTTTKIDFVGNMIVVNGTVYLFKNGNYSAGFDVNNINFRMNLGAQGNGVAVMYDGVKFSYPTSGSTNLPKLYEQTFKADKTYDQINADFKLLEDAVKKGDYISGACFLRYAIRLYDGSYVGVSRPVLVNPDNYYSINGEKYKEDSAPTKYTYNANPLKFALKTTSACTEPVPGHRINPQLGLIQSLFGSTLFWNYIQMYDQGSYVSVISDIINYINNELNAENASANIKDTDDIIYNIANLYIRNKQGINPSYTYKNFQPVDLDYWLLSKGRVGFREIIQFNNNKFNKDKYYKYDLNLSAGSRLMYFDYITNLKGIKEYERNQGWTWGAIPYLVPRLYDSSGSQEATWNTSNTPMIIAATLSPYAAGHDKTVDSVNYATLLAWMQKTTQRDPWSGKTPTVLSGDALDDSPSWFTTRYEDNGLYPNHAKELYVPNGEYPYQHCALYRITPFPNGKGCVYAPMNEHIGELGFGVFNKSFFEGNTTSQADNNVSMVFGRECYTPVYEILEAANIPEGLVQSVDIFMSLPVSVHEDYKTDSIRFDTMAAHRPYRKEKDVVDDLNKSLGKFYKIHSIPIEEIIGWNQNGSNYYEHPRNKVMMPYLNRGSIANLEQQQLLEWSGNNKVEYKVSYVYNNKLHIAQISEIFNENLYDDCNDEISHVVTPTSVDCYDQATNAHLDVDSRMAKCNNDINGVPGTSNGFVEDLKTSLARPAQGISYLNIPDIRLVYLLEMTIDGVTSIIVQKQKIDVIRQHPNTIGFFYPSSDAKRVTLLGFEATKVSGAAGKYFYEFPVKVLNLVQDKTNMISYNFQLYDTDDYFNLGKISSYNVLTDESQFPYKQYESNNTYARDLNIFKVSETNQPLVFPYANTYRVGYGKIIAFSSYTTALSQGQFGEYPLLVFTTEGIFTMKVDTSGIGSYVSNAPLSREVCTNPNTIVQVDGGVFFGTAKGLMFISGDNVKKWSEQINGEPNNLPNSSANYTTGDGLVVYYNAITNANLVQLQSTTTPITTSISQEDFVDYINLTDTCASYLYELNKLLIYNKTKDYSYLIDIDEEGKCTKLGKRYHYDNGDYPNCLVSDGTTLRKFSLDGKTDAVVDCLIQTRPILLDTEMPKSQFRVVLRGIFNNYVPQSGTNYSGLYVLGSIDGEKWMFIGGSEIAHISSLVNDIGTTIERMSVKYLMVIYASRNNVERTKIDNIEISSNEKYNDKTR